MRRWLGISLLVIEMLVSWSGGWYKFGTTVRVLSEPQGDKQGTKKALDIIQRPTVLFNLTQSRSARYSLRHLLHVHGAYVQLIFLAVAHHLLLEFAGLFETR